MITYKKHAVFAINKNTMNIWSRWQKPIHFPTFVKHVLGKPLGAISAVQMDFCHEGGGGLKTLSKWFGPVI